MRLPVDVSVVAGPTPLRAAIAATRTIPTVMAASSSYPVGEGLLASLARQEGNLTGLAYAVSSERFGKQPELLKQAASGIRRVAVWWDSDLAQFDRSWQAPLEAAAQQLGLQVLPPVQVLERSGRLRVRARRRGHAEIEETSQPQARRDGARGSRQTAASRVNRKLSTLAGIAGRPAIDLLADELVK